MTFTNEGKTFCVTLYLNLTTKSYENVQNNFRRKFNFNKYKTNTLRKATFICGLPNFIQIRMNYNLNCKTESPNVK